MDRTEPWGKYRGNEFHHLAHHCADVAACFYRLSELKVIKSNLDTVAGYELSEHDIQRLSLLAFLHDCGKLHPGFQAKGWSGDFWPAVDQHGHLQEGYAIFLDGVMNWQIADALHLSQLQEWGVDLNLLSAVISHHGKPIRPTDIGTKRWKAVDQIEYDPVAASRAIGEILPHWFPDAFAKADRHLPNSPAFQHLFCGLVSLADWIGSDERFFQKISSLNIDYYPNSLKRASRTLEAIGMDPSRWRAKTTHAPSFDAISPGLTPRPAQKLIGEWSTEDALLILEAETGSGKTEAAIWRFANLFTACKVDSLYFAVPTRAAAKQLHTRVNRAIKTWLGEKAPEAVLV